MGELEGMHLEVDVIRGGDDRAVAINRDGNLVREATGEVIAVAHPDTVIERAVSCLWGRVLEGGLGLGRTRDALLQAQHVAELMTVENDDAVVSKYESDSEAPSVVVADLRDVMAEKATNAAKGDREFDCAFFDLDPSPILSERDVVESLKAMFDRAGDRVVVVTEDRSFEIPGFARHVERTENGFFLMLFDRFDPDAGIGVRNPHGAHFVPGYGWQD